MNSYEGEYLRLLQNVISNGKETHCRNGKTLSIFGEQIKFDLSDGFPLLTTKKMFFKGIIGELLWFIRGDTDSKILQEKGINIWNGNSSRKSLDQRCLFSYDEGTCGPIYGFQWRHFNANYSSPHADYKDKGVDQLSNVIEMIQTDPRSRRILLTSWNPEQQHKMCLEPCHVLYQFNVADGKLNCHMYQRSCDVFLGLPFNIASVSLLTILISRICNLIPGRIIISFGDVHVYQNHIEQSKLQLTRTPFDSPSVLIQKPLNSLSDLEQLEISDIELLDYKCHPRIIADMVP